MLQSLRKQCKKAEEGKTVNQEAVGALERKERKRVVSDKKGEKGLEEIKRPVLNFPISQNTER